MNEREFKARTKGVALRVIKMTETLPNRRAPDVLARQLLRSATSVGANYRAACRSRSTADMISRLSIAEEEADESIYWIELLTAAGFVAQKKVAPLTDEIEEILRMIVASIKTLRRRPIQNPKSKIQNA
jgi:four helix bundle protein